MDNSYCRLIYISKKYLYLYIIMPDIDIIILIKKYLRIKDQIYMTLKPVFQVYLIMV